jgi:AcrR family transcriptional regulator
VWHGRSGGTRLRRTVTERRLGAPGRHQGKADRISVALGCEEAGCTPATVYHDFPHLPALLAAACRGAFDDWARAIDARIGDEADLRRRLRLRGQADVEWALEHQRAYRATFPASTSTALAA